MIWRREIGGRNFEKFSKEGRAVGQQQDRKRVEVFVVFLRQKK